LDIFVDVSPFTHSSVITAQGRAFFNRYRRYLMSDPVIEIRRLSFAYNRQPVLEEVDLTIERGDFVAVIGPNGGGKTTLLKLMLGLLQPMSGTVSIMNQSADRASHHIGYVSQDVAVNRGFPITALEVALMGKLTPGYHWHRQRRQDRLEALAALEKMGMDGYAQRRIGELSGGQRQRVFIARALLTHPDILLLDEPTANVDPEGQAELYELLKELNREVTVVVVSHEWLVISTYVKSVACVNRRLHFHHHPEIDADMMNVMYPPTSLKAVCPVELVAHGVPHRVLKPHRESADD
jgi:zinc transport system ATP-binding protein